MTDDKGTAQLPSTAEVHAFMRRLDRLVSELPLDPSARRLREPLYSDLRGMQMRASHLATGFAVRCEWTEDEGERIPGHMSIADVDFPDAASRERASTFDAIGAAVRSVLDNPYTVDNGREARQAVVRHLATLRSEYGEPASEPLAKWAECPDPKWARDHEQDPVVYLHLKGKHGTSATVARMVRENGTLLSLVRWGSRSAEVGRHMLDMVLAEVPQMPNLDLIENEAGTICAYIQRRILELSDGTLTRARLERLLDADVTGEWTSEAKETKAALAEMEQAGKCDLLLSEVCERWPIQTADLREDDVAPAVSDACGAGATPPTTPEGHDEDGFIVNPTDESAFVPATVILNEHADDIATTYKQLKAILDERRDTIRQWKPTSQRLSVHLADWWAFRKQHSSMGEDDGWAPPAEVEQRKVKLRKGESAGK